MTDTPTLSPLQAEDALLDGLLKGVENARATVAAMQALEMTLLATASAVVDERMSRIEDRSSRAREMPMRSVAAEFASALRVSDRAMQHQLGDATAIVGRLPRSLAALGEGTISRAHVRVIAEAGIHIDDDEARGDYERSVLAVAARETAGRLRPIARRLAEKAERRSLTERHAEARRSRGVFVRDLDDGMTELSAVLPAVLAHGMHDRLTRLAHAVQDAERASSAGAGAGSGAATDAGTGDRDLSRDDAGGAPDARTPAEAGERSMDELRADILCDLTLTGEPVGCADAARAIPGGFAGIRATVRVTLPAATMQGGDDVAELEGHGPIDAETARLIADAIDSWDRVFTDPVTGFVLSVDRYQPSSNMRRTLQIRDQHCRFPGCRMPAVRCDVDHTIDAARGGPTRLCNLAHLCRRHHSLKHSTGWSVVQLTNGDLAWTSPLGRRYVDVPESRVVFAASVDPPPF